MGEIGPEHHPRSGSGARCAALGRALAEAGRKEGATYLMTTTTLTPKYYWPLDEGSGFTATDIVSNAKITLDHAAWVAGKYKTGVRFNPKDGAARVVANLPMIPTPW